MSIKAMDAVFGMPADAKVSSAERLVLLALGDCANDDGECWPGHDRVAAKTGVSKRRVRYMLRRLVARGFLEIHVRNRVDGSQSSNLYRLCFPALDALQDGGGEAARGQGGGSPRPGGRPPGAREEAPRGQGGRPPAAPPIEPSSDPSLQQDLKTTDSARGPETAPPKPPTAEERREAEAEALVDLYGQKVKPPGLDTSRHQARVNVVKLLEKGQTASTLTVAVENYVETCELAERALEFRKNAGNFFGRERVFEQFLPGAYVKPSAAARPSTSATLAERNRASLEAMRRQAERKGS